MEAELIPAGSEKMVLTLPRSAAELGNLSTQALRAELAKSLTLSARHLAYLAMIWRELENRGEDMSDLRTGLAIYLPQIAAGHLDAEAVIRYAGQPSLLRNIATLPIEQQRRLVAGEAVPVLTVGANGEYQQAALPAHTLTPAQARMVFDAGKLRSVDEQRAMFEAQRVAAKRRTRPGPDGRVRYDPKTDQIRIGRSAAPVGEVVAAIVSQPRPETPAGLAATDMASTAMIKMTEQEHRQLKIRAAESGLSVQEFARLLLIKFAAL